MGDISKSVYLYLNHFLKGALESFSLVSHVPVMFEQVIINETRTVRGSDYSPAVELSEQKDKLVNENWRD